MMIVMVRMMVIQVSMSSSFKFELLTWWCLCKYCYTVTVGTFKIILTVFIKNQLSSTQSSSSSQFRFCNRSNTVTYSALFNSTWMINISWRKNGCC
jgi:hypothetical protein